MCNIQLVNVIESVKKDGVNVQRLLYSEEEKGSKTRKWRSTEGKKKDVRKMSRLSIYISKARFVMVHYLA